VGRFDATLEVIEADRNAAPADHAARIGAARDGAVGELTTGPAGPPLAPLLPATDVIDVATPSEGGTVLERARAIADDAVGEAIALIGTLHDAAVARIGS